MAKKTFIVKKGMSALDIALFCYGDASKLFQLIIDNPDFDFNKRDYSGLKINYTPNNNANSIKRLFTNQIPATSIYDIPAYLLQENSFNFILEDGSGKIELE